MNLKAVAFLSSLIAFTFAGSLVADASPPVDAQLKAKAHPVQNGSLKPFTGRIVGKKVRLRTSADVEATIVRELEKNELISVVGEKSDFYAVEPPSDIRAYVFRSFIIDGVVEGNRVNVRLSPHKEAPVVAHLNAGERIEGKLADENSKWLEISIPKGTQFYVAKEFIEFAGGPEMKLVFEKRKASVNQLMESTALLTEAELRKPFTEIDIERLEHNYATVCQDFKDFPEEVERAKKALTALKEQYLQKKIQHLESKAKQLAANAEKRDISEKSALSFGHDASESLSPSDRMKVWEPVEESLFLTWSALHHAKSMEDFYEDQRLKSTIISGTLETFKEPIKNRPGDYVVKRNDVPVAFVYSTQLNLQDYVGKKVNLTVYDRPNNNFAFPAYYVLDAE